MRLVHTEDGKIVRHGVRLYPNKERYEGEFVDGKREGKGIMLSDASRYEGEWKSNLYHGAGVHTSHDFRVVGPREFEGTKYAGEFVQGAQHGRGKLWHEGSIYEGLFSWNRKHGSGKVLYANGGEYKGEFRRNKAEPSGQLLLANGDMYVGGFKAGSFDGKGECSYASPASFYCGEFCRGEYDGEGKREYADGSVYLGRYDQGKRCGEGMMRYASGDHYIGSWLDDVPHGDGSVAMVATGDRYEGQFERGVFSGVGKYIYADGGYYKGEYNKKAERHGTGIRVWVSGNCYKGQFRHNRIEGKGTFWGTDGRCLEAYFVDGLAQGHGKERWGNQLGVSYRCGLGFKHHGNGFCTYIGCYRRGQFDGYGEIICVDGRGYKGEWRVGQRHGMGEMISCPDSERGDPNRRQVGGVDAMYRTLRYEGDWVDGVKHGSGLLEYVDGTKLCGPFVWGHPHGQLICEFVCGTSRPAQYATGRRLRWSDECPGNGSATRMKFCTLLAQGVHAGHRLGAQQAVVIRPHCTDCKRDVRSSNLGAQAAVRTPPDEDRCFHNPFLFSGVQAWEGDNVTVLTPPKHDISRKADCTPADEAPVSNQNSTSVQASASTVSLPRGAVEADFPLCSSVPACRHMAMYSAEIGGHGRTSSSQVVRKHIPNLDPAQDANEQDTS